MQIRDIKILVQKGNSSDGINAIVEQAPLRRPYLFLDRSYDLWFPWIYYRFVHRLNSDTQWAGSFQGIYCSPTKIVSGTDHIHLLPLPNLCAGDPCCAISWKNENFHSSLDEAMSNWWGSPGNWDDFPHGDPVVAKFRVRLGIEGYMKFDQANSFFTWWSELGRGQVLDLPWADSKRTAAQRLPEMFTLNP